MLPRSANKVKITRNLRVRSFGGFTPGCNAGMLGGPIDTSEPDYLDHDDEPEFPRHGKVVVFGGTGFVGQEICRTMVCRGYDVISVSPSGTQPEYTTEKWTKFRAPNNFNYDWAHNTQWVQGDIFKPETYKNLLKTDDPKKPFLGVISCVGAFGSPVKMNGEANKILVDACAEAKVPRFCYVSGAVFPAPISTILSGYYKGKKMAEDAVLEKFPETGICIRAGPVLGTKWLGGVVPFSMWWPLLIPRILANVAMQPMFKSMGMDKVFIKPIHVEQLASSCSNFLERPNIRFKGVVDDYWDIRRLGLSFTDIYSLEQKWHFVR